MPKAVKFDPEVEAFLNEVRDELTRARALFPGRNLNMAAAAEEMGEVVKAMLDEPSANVRKEAVQLAAMAGRCALEGDASLDDWRKRKGLSPLPGKKPREVL